MVLIHIYFFVKALYSFLFSKTTPSFFSFIIHSDINNPTVSSLEDFGSALDTYEPDLLLVSGLQMMDNFPFKEGQRLGR